MISPKQTVGLLKRTYSEWGDHQAPRLGASVAFYSILSFAPLILLITAIIGLAFGHDNAQGTLISEARQVMGDRGADTVQNLLKNAQKPASGAFASAVAFITLLFGASGVFAELQDALNLMWDAKAPDASGFLGMVKQRLFSFGMVLTVGFLLLVSLLLSAGLAFLGHSFGQFVPMPPSVLQAINFVISFAVITGLFALMFKYVPAAKVSWKDVGVGAVGTALLFTIGKLLLGLYLGKASVGSTYGAAGSLVAVVVWIYYSAQIFFFGAEFTHLYSERNQGKSSVAAEPKEPAASVPPKEPKLSEPKLSESKRAEVAATTAVAARVGSSVIPPPRPQPALAVASLTTDPAIEKPAVHLPVPTGRPRTEKTKPQLLMSLAAGFVLGRVSTHLGKKDRQPR